MRGRSASGGSLRWNDPDRFHGYDLSRVAAAPQAVNNHDGHSRTIAQERWRRPLPRRIIGQPPNHARPKHRAGSIARAAPPLEDTSCSAPPAGWLNGRDAALRTTRAQGRGPKIANP